MKLKFTFLLVVGILVFGVFDKVNASNDWVNYFSQDESDAIKKMVKKSIRNEFKDPDKNWKGIIDTDLIKDGAITTDKLADNAGGIKKKIYTLKIECNESFADKVIDEDENEKNYYKKIDIEELNLSNPPLVSIYSKNVDDNDDWDNNGWRIDGMTTKIEEGKVWIYYATDDGGFHCLSRSDYKVVIGY